MTDTWPRPADHAQRQAALDPGRSFIVQAPAGSGKTGLLTQRFLRLLATADNPEEIVAITFTRKAAAEMRSRVTRQVSPDLATRLRIQTIDALCASLTAQMPVLARFGAQPAIAEDATDLYREAAARTLADLTPPVARLLAHLGGVLPALQHGTCAPGVESDLAGEPQQHLVRARVLAACVIGGEQGALQFDLPPLEARPVQQAVRVEGVPGSRTRTECKADFGAAVADQRLPLGHLLRRPAVLPRHVAHDVRAFRRHAGIQLERLQVQFDRHLAAEPLERLLQR